MVDQSVLVPMTLSDLERRGTDSFFHSASPYTYTHTVSLGATKFGTLTRV